MGSVIDALIKMEKYYKVYLMTAGPEHHGRFERKADRALERGKTFVALRLSMQANIRDKIRDIVDLVSVTITQSIHLRSEDIHLLIDALLQLNDKNRLCTLADVFWDRQDYGPAILMLRAAEDTDALEQRGTLLLQWGNIDLALLALRSCCDTQMRAKGPTLLDFSFFHEEVSAILGQMSTEILASDPEDFHAKNFDGVLRGYEFLSSPEAFDALLQIGHRCRENDQPIWAIDAYGRALKIAEYHRICVAEALLMQMLQLFREYGAHEPALLACKMGGATDAMEKAGVEYLEAGKLRKAAEMLSATIARTKTLRPKTLNAIQRTIRRLEYQAHQMLNADRLSKAKYFQDSLKDLQKILAIFSEEDGGGDPQ